MKVGKRVKPDAAVLELLVHAVQSQAVQVHVKPEVGAKPLRDREDPAVQARQGGQPQLRFHAPPKVLHEATRKAAIHRGEQRGVIAQPHTKRRAERKHPLPIRYGGKQMVDPRRRALAHPPAHARGAGPKKAPRPVDFPIVPDRRLSILNKYSPKFGDGRCYQHPPPPDHPNQNRIGMTTSSIQHRYRTENSFYRALLARLQALVPPDTPAATLLEASRPTFEALPEPPRWPSPVDDLDPVE